jgi:hypothetical protein
MRSTLVTYNPANGQLETIPEAFKERGLPVEVISWRRKEVIDEGKSVVPGMALADIFWADNKPHQAVLCAPTSCSGLIRAVNRAIKFDDLARPPAQVLLRLGGLREW